MADHMIGPWSGTYPKGFHFDKSIILFGSNGYKIGEFKGDEAVLKNPGIWNSYLMLQSPWRLSLSSHQRYVSVVYPCASLFGPEWNMYRKEECRIIKTVMATSNEVARSYLFTTVPAEELSMSKSDFMNIANAYNNTYCGTCKNPEVINE